MLLPAILKPPFNAMKIQYPSRNTSKNGFSGPKQHSRVFTGIATPWPTPSSPAHPCFPTYLDGNTYHRHLPSFKHQCSSCAQDLERDNHILQCTHLLCQQWQKDLFNKIHGSSCSYLDPAFLLLSKLGSKHSFKSVSHHTLRSQRWGAFTDQQRQLGMSGTSSFGASGVSSGGNSKYDYAKWCLLLDVSKHWQVSFICSLANALFRLWEIHNKCRHSIDNATKSQAQMAQTQHKVQCLYGMHEQVLLQDCHMFQASVETHLKDTQAQQCTSG
jgi:hypothetical protein